MLKRLIKSCCFWFIGLISLIRFARQRPIYINIIGDIYSESGLGSVARQIIESIDGLGDGVEYQLINLPMSLGSRQRNKVSIKHVGTKLNPGINLFIGNPDILLRAFVKLNTINLLQNYNIGIWFWELDSIPEPWRNTENLIDEVWAQSEFVATVFRGASKKVFVMPFALDGVLPSNRPRSGFGIPDDAFAFLFTFDFLSHIKRKNPVAVIDAFLSAFTGRRDILLIIKAVNGSRVPDELKKLKEQISLHQNIHLVDEYLSYEDLLCLIKSANCYVSLHRSEGLGLGMAEAMKLGKAVIATGYSGNMEFMNQENALLVDYCLVPVSRDDYPYGGDSMWADPDISSAISKMNYATDNPDNIAKLGKQALASMEKYNSSNQRKWIAKRLFKT